MKMTFFNNRKHTEFIGIVFQVIQMDSTGTQLQQIYDGVNRNFSMVCLRSILLSLGRRYLFGTTTFHFEVAGRERQMLKLFTGVPISASVDRFHCLCELH